MISSLATSYHRLMPGNVIVKMIGNNGMFMRCEHGLSTIALIALSLYVNLGL